MSGSGREPPRDAVAAYAPVILGGIVGNQFGKVRARI